MKYLIYELPLPTVSGREPEKNIEQVSESEFWETMNRMNPKAANRKDEIYAYLTKDERNCVRIQATLFLIQPQPQHTPT